MTDELRTPNPAIPASSGAREGAAGRARRAYARPTLVELGSVRELTRGASNGTQKDGQGGRRF